MCCIISDRIRVNRKTQGPSLQRLRKPTLLSIAYLDKGSSLRSQNEQSKRRKEGTWECCKEVSHRLWTETYYGQGYRSGCPDNGGEMGSLSIVEELFLFRGYLTFRHIFVASLELVTYTDGETPLCHEYKINNVKRLEWNNWPFSPQNNFINISKTFTPLVN